MKGVIKSSSAAFAELKKERSCVSTTSLTLWRVSTRLLATAELLNAGSGLTEQKKVTNLNAFLAYSFLDAVISAQRIKASH